MKKSDEQFSKKAKTAFDASVDALDAETLSRLNRGRQQALEALDQPRWRLSTWAPATGVAAAVLVAVVLLQSPVGMDTAELPSAVADMEILLGEDSIDMLEELEFYSWLETTDLGGDVS